MKKREKALIGDHLRPSARLSRRLSSRNLLPATKCGSDFYGILCRSSLTRAVEEE